MWKNVFFSYTISLPLSNIFIQLFLLLLLYLIFIFIFAHCDIFSISGKNRWHVAESLPGSPMIVFVNCKSGGGYGEKFLRRFKQILNPGQVFDIANTGPAVGYVVFPI